MTKKARAFIHDESATTAIEYTIIASGIAVAMLASLNELGPMLRGGFQIVAAMVSGGPPQSM